MSKVDKLDAARLPKLCDTVNLSVLPNAFVTLLRNAVRYQRAPTVNPKVLKISWV